MKLIIAAKKRAHFLAKKKDIKLKEALELVARENRFTSWKEYKNSLDIFWYQKSSLFLNHWFSSREEARQFHRNNSGFLLTYKGQYFVATAEYISHLGLDPEAEIWKAIGYDISPSKSLEKFFQYFQKEQESSHE